MELWDRAEEVALLAEEAERARTGQLRVVVVEGPAGIGRTSLVERFTASPAAAGLTVLRARGTELERRFAFGVVRQLFSPLLFRLSDEDLAAVLAGGAEPARQVLADPGAPAVAPEHAPFAVLHGLHRLAANLCRRGPLLLVLDDADLADAPSLRWLRYVRTRLARSPVLLVLTRRTGGVAGDVLGGLVREPDCVHLRPRLLSPAGVAGLVAAALPVPPTPEFTRACHELSGGNPAAVRALLAAADGSQDPRALPAGAVFAHVLARLPAPAVAYARALSVLGDVDTAEQPTRLTGLTGAEGRVAEDQLTQAGLLMCDPLPRWRHPAVREAVYRELAEPERARLHHAAATLLHDAGAPLEQVCAHLLRTPPAADAWVVATLCAAAAQANRRGAPDGAAEYLRRALAEPPGPELRVAVEAGLGMAESFSQPAAAIDRLYAVSGEITDPALRTAVAETLSDALGRENRAPEMMAVLARAAADLAEVAPDRADQLTGRRLIVSVSERTGPRGARRPPEPVDAETPGRRCVFNGLAFAAGMGGAPAPEVARLARLAAPRTTAELTSAIASTVCLLLGWTEDLAGAVDLCERAMAESRRTHALIPLALQLSHRAQLAQFTGRLTEALALAESSVELLPLEQWGYLATVPLSTQAELLLALDRPAQARSRLLSNGLASLSDNGFGSLFHRTARARVRMACGEPEEGLADLLAAGEVLRERGYDNPVMLPWRVAAVEALLAQGDRAQATALAAESTAAARRWGTPRALGVALRLTALTTGDLTAARESVALLSGLEAPLELAASRHTLGRLHAEAGEVRPARTALRHCLEEAERRGAARLAGLAREDLIATGARPKPSAAALSPGERRVAELAASGLANRQIAETLHLTLRTVETHLSATYRKLGLANRAALREHFRPET
ncbi:DNA-binding CsgD family transcriptional regulator [Crossiella equi]|uniref:DNA-binding CsgD family transcriptional regulator n=1 Tax=Crossiella equi TaxID=130796 RepID=A0ABS5A7N5_9PSEU|nr:LuxR family transcriptional regulator [Crossiella equi]MBP2472239.1 DNA-binding CsgD family transcriptional regulator [Crossiella equi]